MQLMTIAEELSTTSINNEPSERRIIYGAFGFDSSRVTSENRRKISDYSKTTALFFSIVTLLLYDPLWFMNWVRCIAVIMILSLLWQSNKIISYSVTLRINSIITILLYSSLVLWVVNMAGAIVVNEHLIVRILRPNYTRMSPYNTSSYYQTTLSLKALNTELRHIKNEKSAAGMSGSNLPKSKRLAIVRPFCEFDDEALPRTFSSWEGIKPCYKDVNQDSHVIDLFLSYSQTYSENSQAMKSADYLISQFWKLKDGGWAECFGNIYAIEQNIAQELDLYIPTAQEDLYNWINGPNRQFERMYRIIGSGEWGQYDAMFIMEGDVVIRKEYWLNKLLDEISSKAPFAVLGSEYLGGKYDPIYDQLDYSFLHKLTGNSVYNMSSELLQHLVGQLEVEARSPYNSIPYDNRISQILVEGQYGIVARLGSKIMLDEEGRDIPLSNNTALFHEWWKMYSTETPYKSTGVLADYAATNLLPHHLGEESLVHGAKLYSYYNSSLMGNISIVISSGKSNTIESSLRLQSEFESARHIFSEIVLMVDHNKTLQTTFNSSFVGLMRLQYRAMPAYMDLCEADVQTEWFMLADTGYGLAKQLDLMVVQSKFVVSFIPATHRFCFQFPYCREDISIAQKIYPYHYMFFANTNMIFHTATRDKFCEEWKTTFGKKGENLIELMELVDDFDYKQIIRGPTATSYSAFTFSAKRDKLYRHSDASLFGKRNIFLKIKPDHVTSAPCICYYLDDEDSCKEIEGCAWRSRFESCHAVEMRPDDARQSTMEPYAFQTLNFIERNDICGDDIFGIQGG